MNKHDVWDVAIAFIATLPATIAAISSLRNGRKIDKQSNGVSSPVKKRPKKNGQHPDWYTPPEL